MRASFFVTSFLNHLSAEKRCSSLTVVAYQHDVEEFASYISEKKLEDATAVDIRNFIYYLKEQSLDNASINRKISALRTFYKWLEQQGKVEVNPLLKTTLLKQPKRLPNFIQESELECEKLDRIFDETTFSGKRDRLMFEIFYQTGIRRSELIQLRIENVNPQSIKVLGKRNKERIIPISSALYERIHDYLLERNSIQSGEDSLFILENGKKMYPKFVYTKIKSYLSLVTNNEKKSPHVLRHTFATQLLNNGANIEAIKSLLGHADLRATQIYTHTSLNQLKSIYSQAHPRGHKN